MIGAAGGADDLQGKGTGKSIATRELAAKDRVAARWSDAGPGQCRGTIARRQFVDGIDQPTDQRTRQRSLDHGERASPLEGTAGMPPCGGCTGDRGRSPARRDEEQHGMGDLPHPLVEPASK